VMRELYRLILLAMKRSKKLFAVTSLPKRPLFCHAMNSRGTSGWGRRKKRDFTAALRNYRAENQPQDFLSRAGCGS